MHSNDEERAQFLEVRKPLEQFSTKVQERFKHIKDAFMFIDVNNNAQISYTEFHYGLDRMRLKLSDADSKHLFDFIDSDGKGYI